MAKTFSQIYIQFVFAVKHRHNLLKPEHNDELQKYITGIVRNCDSKLLAINNMPDHVHILIGKNPSWSESKLVQTIKANSSRFIKTQQNLPQFEWQEGYGVFSYSRSQIDAVCQYIASQQKHHQSTNFKTEYLEILQKYNLKLDQNYYFEFYD